MTTMGRPTSPSQSKYRSVTMARKAPPVSPNGINSGEKARLINNLTGYKQKNDLVVNGKDHNKMGKDEFLKLLTHQLTHQDPMKPMDQKDMAAELAQFSQLEQLTNLNTKFDKVNKNESVQQKFYGASFLGKEVVTSGAPLKLGKEGNGADILFTLPKQANKVLVRVFDQKNQMVGEIWQENMGRGNNNITWDGMSLDGTEAMPGEYRTQVYAWDQNADAIEVATKAKGIVESVYFENGENILMVDGKKVFLRDIDSFHSPDAKNKIATITPKLNNMQPDVIDRAKQAARSAMQAKRAPAKNIQANNTATNLPLAQDMKTKVNLNKNQSLNSYKQNNERLSTGLTNVYDSE